MYGNEENFTNKNHSAYESLLIYKADALFGAQPNMPADHGPYLGW